MVQYTYGEIEEWEEMEKRPGFKGAWVLEAKLPAEQPERLLFKVHCTSADGKW